MPGGDRGQEGRLGRVAEQARAPHHVDEERGRGDRHHPRGEAVEPVHQVDRVRDRHDPHDREDLPQVAGQDHDPLPRQPRVGEPHAEQDHDAGDEDLGGELRQGADLPRVVDRTEAHHERASDQGGHRLRARGVHAGEEREEPRQPERGEEPDVHREAAHRGLRLGMHAPVRRLVDHPDRDHEAANERGDRERDPGGGEEQGQVRVHERSLAGRPRSGNPARA